MTTTKLKWLEIIDSCEEKFKSLAASHNAVTWLEQYPLIVSAFQNDQNMQQATPASIRTAIYGIASAGISISGLLGHAHIKARSMKVKGKGGAQDSWRTDVLLSIDYKGQIKVLTDSGAALYIRADVVRDGDHFVYNGPAAMPEIKVTNPFAPERKDVIGAYAIAELANGRVMCEILNLEELERIEKASQSTYGPWKEFRSEMIKKSCINRICKTIPTANSRTLAVAESEAEMFEHVAPEPVKAAFTDEQRTAFDNAIENNDNAAMYHISRSVGETAWIGLYGAFKNTAPRGEKGQYSDRVDSLVNDGRIVFENAGLDFRALMESEDIHGANEVYSEFEGQEETLLEKCDTEVVDWIKDNLNKSEAAA